MKADLEKLRELAARGESISCGCMLLRSIVDELDRLRKIESLAYAMANGGIPGEQLNAMFELRRMLKESTP